MLLEGRIQTLLHKPPTAYSRSMSEDVVSFARISGDSRSPSPSFRGRAMSEMEVAVSPLSETSFSFGSLAGNAGGAVPTRLGFEEKPRAREGARWGARTSKWLLAAFVVVAVAAAAALVFDVEKLADGSSLLRVTPKAAAAATHVVHSGSSLWERIAAFFANLFKGASPA